MSAAPGPRSSLAALLRAVAVVVAAAVPLAPVAALAGTDPQAGRTVVGQLVQAWPEAAAEDTGASEAPLTWVKPAQGRAVRVPTDALAGVPVGSTVSLTVGTTVDEPGAAARPYEKPRAVLGGAVLAPAATGSPSAGSDTPPSEATHTGASASAAVTDPVTVVVVAPQDAATAQATLDRAASAVGGPVRDFWLTQTSGAVSLGVAATDVWTPSTASCADPTTLWSQAAAHAGFVPGPRRHLLLAVAPARTDLAGCSYGLAEVGSGPASGGNVYVRDPLPSLIAHELGHNLGLGHSSAGQCDGAVDTGACRVAGYHDYYDVMGASWEQLGSLNAAQQARLGVLPEAQRRTLAASATATQGVQVLAPISASSGVRALHLIAPGGAEYWLEYRPAAGQDAWLGTSANRFGLQTGVLLHRSGGLPDTSLLLDGTPSSRSRWDADLQVAVPLGAPVTLSGGVVVTLQTLGPAGASLAVVVPPQTAPVAAAAPAPPPSGPVVLGQQPAAPACCVAAPAPAVAPRAPAPAPVGTGAASGPPAAASSGAAVPVPAPSSAPPAPGAAAAPGLSSAAALSATPAAADAAARTRVVLLGAALGALGLSIPLFVVRARRRTAARPV